MYEKLLLILKAYFVGAKDYYQVLSASAAGYHRG